MCSVNYSSSQIKLNHFAIIGKLTLFHHTTPSLLFCHNSRTVRVLLQHTTYTCIMFTRKNG